MIPILILAAAAAEPAAASADVGYSADAIVVTGSREPVSLDEAAISADIFDGDAIERLALPSTPDLLRLVPGVSVSSSGPRGSQTQVRIRGAEANHTLLFVDGIRFNDPAAGNEARFELLGNDVLSRVEVVRGPQSALWGSEALGGVVAVSSADPFETEELSALAEYGSLDSARASAQLATRTGPVGISAAGGWMRSDGIDSFGDGGGERDGFWNREATLKAVLNPGGGELGVVGHYVEGRSEFDGYDPLTGQHQDTLDATRNRIFAVRSWARIETGGWNGLLQGSYLGSANRNLLGDERLNSSFGERVTVSGQLSRTVGGHRFTAAIDHEDEGFRATDQVYFGATDQKRARSLTAFVGQWRAQWSQRLVTDVALRRDHFSAYRDETTVRATALFRPLPELSVHASYGEGIAQPTFYDLYGFFPGSFVGNPSLRPERSRGYEAGLAWGRGSSSIGATFFSNRLRDEIVDTFDPATFLSGTANAEGRSRRRGVEVEARSTIHGVTLAANYTYLDAAEQKVAGTALVREARRPRHSANLIAAGRLGPIDLGGSLAYVGARRDTDFDRFPAVPVRLHDYLLASLSLGLRLNDRIEAFVRSENLFNANYQDAVGYNTAGRTVYAGLRLRPRA